MPIVFNCAWVTAWCLVVQQNKGGHLRSKLGAKRERQPRNNINLKPGDVLRLMAPHPPSCSFYFLYSELSTLFSYYYCPILQDRLKAQLHHTFTSIGSYIWHWWKCFYLVFSLLIPMINTHFSYSQPQMCSFFEDKVGDVLWTNLLKINLTFNYFKAYSSVGLQLMILFIINQLFLPLIN